MAASGMGEREQTRTLDARYRDRRIDERYEINVPGGCLNYKGTKYPCMIVDVSLSGCCVRTESRFLPGNVANVEVVLPILGMVLHLVGTTQWVTRANLIGVRFLHPSSRSKNQLAGLLTCLVDQGDDAEELRKAVVAEALSGNAYLDVEVPKVRLATPKHTPIPKEVREVQEHPAHPPRAERSDFEGPGAVQNREKEPWRAVLRLLKDNTQQKGAITGLRLEGCCLHTAEPFVAGIHARVEVDFQMRGLPFLLAGVTEDVRNKKTVDIRFLEISFRKRQELADLIEELREATKKQSK
jgi:hypothetical protein